MSVGEEVSQELDFHVEMRTRELMSKGMSAGEARALAIARFGDILDVNAKCRRIAKGRDRDMRIVEWLDELKQDLVFAARQMRRAPLVTLLVVLMLSLGIGATTVVFSVVNAVLLRPLPFPEPERLVYISERTPEGQRFSTSDANFLDFRQQQRNLTDLAAIAFPFRQFSMIGAGEPIRFQGIACTGSMFKVLGVRPLLGRTFLPEEDRPGSDSRVMVMSEGLWKRSFGSDPDVVGRTIALNDGSWTVVGIMPVSFEFLGSSDVWIPYPPDPEFERGDRRLEMVGRLAPGITLDQAQADMSGIARRLGELFPKSNKDWDVKLVSFPEWIIGPQVRQANLVLLFAVGLLLLLASANVSNLLIARATTRSREISLRAALGAGRFRIVRQLLTESIALSLLGAAAGLAVAHWAMPILRNLSPDALPRLDEATLDGGVLFFTIVVSFGVGIFIGMVPALHISRGNLFEALQEGRQSVAAGGRRLRDLLVVGEVALAMILLIGAGLLVSSFERLRKVDPGFDPTNLLGTQVILPENKYPEQGRQTAQFYRELLGNIGTLPGVESAGATMINPFRGPRPSNQIAPEGVREQSEFTPIRFRIVTAGYFRTMCIPLLQGRLFDERDNFDVLSRSREGVAILNAKLVERLWPGEDPIGKRIQWNSPGGLTARIIGVVGDVKDLLLDAEPELMLYFNHEQITWPHMTLVVRTAGEPASVSSAVVRSIAQVDPSVPAPEAFTIEDNFAEAVAAPRFNSQLLGAFASLALAMACFGLYGVMSYSVARRTREIGIRVALGAHRGNLVSLVLRHGIQLILIGAALGIAGALGLTRFLRNLLYETSPTDFTTYLAMALLLAVVGVAASTWPAMRASRVDPVDALRME
jgi:predicted permease